MRQGQRATTSRSSPRYPRDGRFVAFSSAANTLSGEDNDAFTNVFVRDVLGEPALLPPPSTPAPAAAATDTTGPRLLARANRPIRVSRDGRFRLFCGRYAEPVTGTCRVRKLGVRSFAVAAGKRALVRFRLPRAARRALTRTGRLRMRATVIARDRGGNATTARFRVVLSAGPRHRRERGAQRVGAEVFERSDQRSHARQWLAVVLADPLRLVSGLDELRDRVAEG